MSVHTEQVEKWLEHWGQSDRRAEEVLRDSAPLAREQWAALAEHYLRERFGRVPSEHDLRHVAKELGLDKLDGPAGGFTRATAEALAEQVGATWQDMRSRFAIPAPEPEQDASGESLGSLAGDIQGLQARAGWGLPSGDPETAARWHTEAFGGEPGEELGSLNADLASLQRARGLTK